MKKGIISLFCAMALMGSVTVSAGPVDFSQYSADELIQIQQDLDAALYEKGGFVTAEVGVYVVGKDIAAGSYTLKPFPADGPDGIGVLQYTIYKSEDAKAEYEVQLATNDEVNKSNYISAEGSLDSEGSESGRINVNEGEVIEFSRNWGPVIIAISKESGLFME